MKSKKRKKVKAKRVKRAKKVMPVPSGFHTVTPYLSVIDATQLLEFVKKAFDAREKEVHRSPEGKVLHAAVKIGDSMVMIADAGSMAPTPAALYLYVNDTDKFYKQGLEAGGTSLMEPADQFYGDRNAGVKDASGCSWWIATLIEDVSKKEMQKRMDEAMKKRSAQN